MLVHVRPGAIGEIPRLIRADRSCCIELLADWKLSVDAHAAQFLGAVRERRHGIDVIILFDQCGGCLSTAVSNDQDNGYKH